MRIIVSALFIALLVGVSGCHVTAHDHYRGEPIMVEEFEFDDNSRERERFDRLRELYDVEEEYVETDGERVVVRRYYYPRSRRSHYDTYHHHRVGLGNTLLFGALGGLIGYHHGYRDEGILLGAGYGLLHDLWNAGF